MPRVLVHVKHQLYRSEERKAYVCFCLSVKLWTSKSVDRVLSTAAFFFLITLRLFGFRQKHPAERDEKTVFLKQTNLLFIICSKKCTFPSPLFISCRAPTPTTSLRLCFFSPVTNTQIFKERIVTSFCLHKKYKWDMITAGVFLLKGKAVINESIWIPPVQRVVLKNF